MKKEIRTVDEERGIIQVTTTDERWYVKETENKKTGLPEYKFVPSATWICSYYPKGIQFYQWLASKGWDESQAIKESAGARGSKIHKAIEVLLQGETIEMNSRFVNPKTGELEELTVDEYEAICSFYDWYIETNPEIISSEIVVWNDEHNYAGTVDLVLNIQDKKTNEVETWIVDIKSGQSIWKEYELQISCYKHALKLENEPRLAVLQVGYRKNKRGWKFTEIEDKFDLFLTAKRIWAEENSGAKPQQKDYPLRLSIVKENENEELIGDTEES